MSNDPKKHIIENLLDQWEEAQEKGSPVSPENLCTEHPELVNDLKKQIDSLDQINRILKPQTEILQSSDGNGLQEQTLDETFIANIGLTEAQFHAEGALGRVYLALDTELNREVAIKFMQKRHMHDQARKERFCLEAEITSRLYHPGVVPVHGIGQTEDKRPFYVMQFVHGETLQKTIDTYYSEADRWNVHRRNLEFRNLLAHFVTICNTIAYAHNRGVIHRDIKPENVIIGRYGESMVVDWGLAMPVDRDESARASGEKTLFPSGHQVRQRSGHDLGAGTPAYMSPEQASGQSSMTVSSDIYSLGSILYKILCGKSPVDGIEGGIQQIRQKVIDGEWNHPKSISAQCPNALEAVCLKAMHLQASKRYPSALELANEVERFLADEKVQAYQESPLETPLRFFRQHRRMAQITAISIVLLLAVFLGSAFRLGIAARESQAVNETLLKSAAKLTAVTVQMEMDGRWFLLEKEASNPRLIEHLNTNQGTLHDQSRVLFSDLITAIRDRAKLDEVEAESWFICNSAGVQLARHPSGSSIGQTYAHRDYFHGNGIDLQSGKTGSPPHIVSEYLSVPYASSSDGALKVALTCPIYSQTEGPSGRQFLGVLGMSIKLGDFEVLTGNLADGQIAVLANFGSDHFEGQASTGLFLHHPRLSSSFNQEGENALPRLAAGLLKELKASPRGLYLRNYMDPASRNPSKGQWTAAFERVHLRNQSEWEEDRGWVVIVQRPN